MIGIRGESKVMMVLDLGQGRSVTRTLIFGHWVVVVCNRQLGKEVSQESGRRLGLSHLGVVILMLPPRSTLSITAVRRSQRPRRCL